VFEALKLYRSRQQINIDKLLTYAHSPVCLNQWQAGVCRKPKISCSKCDHKLYAALDEEVIENHLRGNIFVGVYGSAQESIMRIDSANIANELMKSIEGA
jgi:hypothetical protein